MLHEWIVQVSDGHGASNEQQLAFSALTFAVGIPPAARRISTALSTLRVSALSASFFAFIFLIVVSLSFSTPRSVSASARCYILVTEGIEMTKMLITAVVVMLSASSTFADTNTDLCNPNRDTCPNWPATLTEAITDRKAVTFVRDSGYPTPEKTGTNCQIGPGYKQCTYHGHVFGYEVTFYCIESEDDPSDYACDGDISPSLLQLILELPWSA